MRALPALLLGLVLAGAAPAYGQKIPVQPAKPAAGSSAQLGLRGAIALDAEAPQDGAASQDPAAAPIALRPLPPLLAPLAQPKADASRCRLTCASNYYFCLSNDATDASCPDTWSQCRAACDAPSGARQIATIPGG